MAHPEHTPVVPLEAGAGPDNPPCPACGEPLFGWLAARPGLRGPVSRCESCGLGVVGPPGDADEALHHLDPQRSAVPFPRITRKRNSGSSRMANRGGFSASLGGAGWAGLEPEARYLFTVEAARRLVARRDQVVKSARWAPAASLAVTWQTLLNSVTFGHNVALAAFGKAGGAPAAKRWQRRIDALVSIVLAIPALLVALPIELAGGLTGRGAVITLRFELL